MSQVPSTSTNFETIFTAALEEYKNQTKKDITSHPLATQLKSCDSPSAILTVLRAQVQAFDKSQGADEKLTKWLDPTVNVLYAFSVILGDAVGLVFPPSSAIFAGIGVLLQAVKDVRASQDTLIDLFSRMEYFFKRLEKYIDVRPSAAMTDIIVKIVVEVLSILGIVTKEIGQGKLKRFFKKLAGMKDVEDALQRLDKLTQEEARMAAAEVLTITRGIGYKVEGVDHKVGSIIKGVMETGVVIQQVFTRVGNLNRSELRKDLRKWIAPPDPSVNYNAAFDAHHEGTAAWCTKGSTLADWKTSGSLLWIHGKPGSGKSILSSVIIQDIKTISVSGSARMAYFFFDFKDKGKQNSRALLLSLIIQLSIQSDQFFDVLLGLFSAHKDGSEQPSNDSLAGCLKDMIMLAGKVPIYLLMDALDECPNDSGIPTPRKMVLELVEELVGLRRPNLRLCITSRPEFDIRTTLEPLATQQLSLHDESGQKQDIIDYVTFVVRSYGRMKKWQDCDKNMVIKSLTEKADGMFQWVFCQLEVLQHCVPANLHRILEELPKSLDETYERILKEINNANREHAYRLLQCLAVAGRPLRVEELAELLALDFSAGGIPTLNTNWRWEDQEETVLSACAGLVSVIVENASRVVQFSHSSVKDFLTSDRLASSVELSRFHIPIETSHLILAQACLGVLLRLDNRTDKDSVEKIPLFRYATEYWCWHAQVGNVESHIKDAMDDFFDMDKPHFAAWVRIQDIGALLKVSVLEQRRAVPPSPAPLYFATQYLLRGLMERLIVKNPQHVNGWGGIFGTPLHVSAFMGHVEVAQLLLAHGADINSRSGDMQTPLHLASQEGHLEVGKWLLNRGADVNSRDKDCMTSLHIAAARGHLEVSRILLECNAEVNCRGEQGVTPLLLASTNGHPDTVRVLLNHNADVHVCANGGWAALHGSAVNGHLEVARILLDHNVEANARSDQGYTPLLLASANGHTDVVQLLLNHNADVHAHDNDKNTPLHHAVNGSHLDVARVLLDCNAEVNARNAGGATPFLRASECGNPDIVWLLLDRNAGVHIRDNHGNSPLHNAAFSGHLEVPRMLLLELNAEVNARNNHRSTPLLIASENGHCDAVQLLLDHNADAYVRDGDGDTPLHCAALGGRLEVARILLELNHAEVNSRNNKGSTPLHLASEGYEEGHADVVQLLLNYGADVQVCNLSGKIASEVARGPKQQEIVQLLSQHTLA